MYQYIVILRQKEDGCDHTIACGTKAQVFMAPGRAAAIEYGENLVTELSHREQTIAEATVYAIDDSITTRLDVALLRAKALAMQDRERGEVDERAEYERLRRKFEASNSRTDLSALKARLQKKR